MATLPTTLSALRWFPRESAHAGHCMALVLAVIVALPGCGSTPDDDPAVDAMAEAGSATAVELVDGLGAVTTPTTSARLARQIEDLDPTVGGWETEVLSEAADGQLSVLAGLLQRPDQLDAAQLSQLIADDFSCGDLRPSEMQNAFDDGPLLVERGVIDLAAVSAETVGTHRGVDSLLAALGALLEPLGEATDVHAKFKLYNVDPSAESFTTRQYFSASGRTATGMVEQNATWLIRWVRPVPTAPPKIAWIGVEDFEEVTTRTEDGPLFADVTEAVLGSNSAYGEQLIYGTDHWLERMERSMVSGGAGFNGLTVGDVNGDGLDDVYMCQTGGFPNLLLIQQPDGTVRDALRASGADILDLSYSALLVDLDNDGDQDLVVATVPHLLILANDGNGRFSLQAKLPELPAAHSLSAIDYDSDGDLDIYGCRYFADPADHIGVAQSASYYDAEDGGATVLLRNDIAGANDGPWAFAEVTGT